MNQQRSEEVDTPLSDGLIRSQALCHCLIFTIKVPHVSLAFLTSIKSNESVSKLSIIIIIIIINIKLDAFAVLYLAQVKLCVVFPFYFTFSIYSITHKNEMLYCI